MTAPTKARATDDMRSLLAFALAVADQHDVPIYSIEVTYRGGELRVWLDADDNKALADRMATLLGVPEDDRIVRDVAESTYTVASRAETPFYYREAEPYPHAGASVPFGDRTIGVYVTCSLSKSRP